MYRDKTQGFTLIELSLAMSFVAALLLAIALTIIQISAIYNRGLTLKDVNQAGITITTDLQQNIADSVPFSVAAPNKAPGSLYILNQTGSVVTGGRLCLGQYSYIWNFGSYLGDNSTQINVYSDSNKAINLVRVYDPGANYCKDDTSTSPYYKIASSSAVDLLNVGDHDLVLHAFSINSSSIDAASGQQLYSIQFTIGTNEANALNTTFSNGSDVGTTTCKLPNVSGADPTYCVVDTFNIVARAGNESSTGAGN